MATELQPSFVLAYLSGKNKEEEEEEEEEEFMSASSSKRV